MAISELLFCFKNEFYIDFNYRVGIFLNSIPTQQNLKCVQMPSYTFYISIFVESTRFFIIQQAHEPNGIFIQQALPLQFLYEWNTLCCASIVFEYRHHIIYRNIRLCSGTMETFQM